MSEIFDKGQASIELLINYGWIILVGLGAAVLISKMGVYSPVQCAKTSMGFSEIMPSDWRISVKSNAMVMSVDNWRETY